MKIVKSKKRYSFAILIRIIAIFFFSFLYNWFNKNFPLHFLNFIHLENDSES